MASDPASGPAVAPKEVAGWLPGVILIVIGVTFLAVQQLGMDGDVVVLIIGLVFAIAYAATRTYGLLVPAGILVGLGSGIVLEDYRLVEEPVVLGIGLGFLAIYVVDALVAGDRGVRRWWPLIPGGILVTIAVVNGAFGPEGARAMELAWPALLILAGAVILVRRAVPPKTG